MIAARKQERASVEGVCRYRFGGGIAVPVRISDLTEGGCRISSIPRALAIGDHISISIDTLAPLFATVKWVESGRAAGLKFDNPLYPSVFSWLLSNMKA
ncbi:PilZ domain-containing protein [Croceicoccus sp. Ery15]|uniref:PilZ domain-containing protein n=1 Tax=Croceicoccus sp. Ery15 TaxID=1703338 RepID=UPI001E5EB9BC|nr:PilZ domain-containing protein [Croceicoccus sp. Ery15]